MRGFSFSLGALIETFLGEDRRQVVDVDAVDHADVFLSRLHDGDIAVAVVVSGSCAVEHAEGFDVSAIQPYDLVSVLCFASVSVVHIFLVGFGYLRRLNFGSDL